MEGSADSFPPSSLINPTDETIKAVIQAYIDGTPIIDIKINIVEDGHHLSFNQIYQVIKACQAIEV